MIQPKHYSCPNLSRPAQRKRTTLITSVNRSRLKVYSSPTSSGSTRKRSRRKSEHYAAVYDAIIKHIESFSLEFNCDIYTNSVTSEFLDDFIVYLEEQGLRHNTIVGYILKIQSLVRRASQYNYAVRFNL